MMAQYIIIGVILLLAVLYAVRRVYLSAKHSADRCYGCSGCELRDKLRERQGKTGNKPKCFH